MAIQTQHLTLSDVRYRRLWRTAYGYDDESKKYLQNLYREISVVDLGSANFT